MSLARKDKIDIARCVLARRTSTTIDRSICGARKVSKANVRDAQLRDIVAMEQRAPSTMRLHTNSAF